MADGQAVLHAISATLDPRPEVIQAAEAQLVQHEQLPQYGVVLMQVCAVDMLSMSPPCHAMFGERDKSMPADCTSWQLVA